MRTCASCGRDRNGDFAFCPDCGAALAVALAQERRKIVTVLFCDVTGSTALGESIEPEAFRRILARYFDRMKAIVGRHGGTVEKFIGDAVMAVFGVPLAHEDDALRAVRAAVEMREALPDLGVQARIGVNSGEVITGTEERLVTGDAVNVAARLEQAAAAGEVLIGSLTYTLLGGAAEAEPVEPLALKGKAQPVPAYRLLRVRQAPERMHRARFVGRRRERATVREAWERVRAGRRCELVTVIGDAGIGKSRLAEEVLASLGAGVVHGRCLPYGEGITYWPVVEVLRHLSVLPENEAGAASIRSLLGESEAATSAEEIAWAFRKTLERAAADRPIAVVFDDIQWGEETFLDLIEHLALLSSGAPILVLCIARPELIDRRPGWPVTLRLGPLGDEEMEELIPESLPAVLRHTIARAAGGNPLFIEEMLAMAGEAGGEVIVPPTLHALLAARLDGLEAAERHVLERGAVEGEIFHRGAVQALAPEEARTTARLAALVRIGLIWPHAPKLPGEDAFRFRHLLMRDAAYEALPKAARADLHRRLAFWVEERGTGLVELDEVIGFHLEQAHRYLAELGMPWDEELAAAARGRLTTAGLRSSVRGDYQAAVTLLGRAAALIPPGELDLALETELGEALAWSGRFQDAIRRADSLAERAAASGDRVGELCGRVKAAMFRLLFDPEGGSEKLAPLVEEALPELNAAGGHLALYIAYQALGWVAFERSQMDGALAAYERAATHARAAGLPHELLGWRAVFRFYGTTPVSELLAWLDEQERQGRRHHWLGATRGGALAMMGRLDEGRAILAETRAGLAERGGGIEFATMTGIESANVELLAGDPSAAAELGAEGCRLLEALGDRGFLSTAAGTLAQALYALDRLNEAETWATRAAELGATDDAPTQMLWRQVRAQVLARRGEHAEAERLAREAVAIGERTDDINSLAGADQDLGEVLVLAGRPKDAAAALKQAAALYERKGNVVMAERVQNRRAALR
jgi:class 3 adenylate cyclase/tetratricopeptide (TPR) repeat protein